MEVASCNNVAPPYFTVKYLPSPKIFLKRIEIGDGYVIVLFHFSMEI